MRQQTTQTQAIRASLALDKFLMVASPMQSVEVTAKLLANEHLREDDGIDRILWAKADDEVRLIEVTSSVTDRGEVLPFRFTPDPPDVPYPSVVILLGLGDWKRIEARELDLPETFRGQLEPIFSR